MAWTYVSEKDGTVMEGIPDDVKAGDPVFLEELAKIRASKGASAPQEQPQSSSWMDTQILPARQLSPQEQLTRNLPEMVKNFTPEQWAEFRKNPQFAGPEFSDPTTISGVAGAVARGNPITATAGLLGDLGNSAVTAMGGKPIILNPNDPDAASKAPSQQIQDWLTSMGVKEPKSNAEKFTQLLSGFIPIGPKAIKDQAAVDAGEQLVKDAAGGRVMTSDVFQPKGGAGQLMQTLSERNPFLGTGSLRVAQQGDRIQAIRDLAKEYGATDLADATDSVMTDLLQKRGSDLGRLTQQKNEVIDRLSEIGSTPVSNTVAAIDEQLAKLKGLKTNEVAPVIAKLEDWKKAVQDQPLANIELLRRQFGNSFNDPGLAGVKETAQKSLNAIYPAVNEDMGAFIKANGKPEDFKAWKEANADLAASMGELENNALRTALDKGDQTPELVQRLLFSGKRSDVETLFKNLTPEGRQRAQAAVLAKAIDGSTTAGTEVISPEKFVTQIQKLGGPVGVLFSGDDKVQLEGVLRYINATRQASKYAANPQTGVQNLVPLLGISSAGGLSGLAGGGALGAGAGLAGTIAGGTTLGLLTRAYESAPVRDALIALARARNPDNIAQLRRVSSALATIENTKGESKGTPSAYDKAREAQRQGVTR